MQDKTQQTEDKTKEETKTESTETEAPMQETPDPTKETTEKATVTKTSVSLKRTKWTLPGGCTTKVLQKQEDPFSVFGTDKKHNFDKVLDEDEAKCNIFLSKRSLGSVLNKWTLIVMSNNDTVFFL